MSDNDPYEACAQRLKALADPERLRIISALFGGAKNVGDLVAELQHDFVKVSHHLGVLRNAKLVTSVKRGRFVEYKLHDDVYAAVEKSDDPKYIDLGCCRLEIPTVLHPLPAPKHRT